MIRLIELFGGIGSQAMAMRDLAKLNGMNELFEQYRLVEFDPFPIRSYNAIFGTGFEPMDITKIHAEDLGIVNTDKFEYLMTYSFPCFVGDTLVLTDHGYLPISEVKLGMKVLSHDGLYHKVTNAVPTGTKEIWQISSVAIPELRCTKDHKFYVRTRERDLNCQEQDVHQFTNLSKPKWKKCKSFTRNDFIGIAINKNSIKKPDWDEFDLWMLGYFFGHSRMIYKGQVRFPDDPKLIPCIEDAGYAYERTKGRITITDELFLEYLSEFKDGRFPGFFFDLPISSLEHFLDGFHREQVMSPNLSFVYGMAQIMAKVYKVPFQIMKMEDQYILSLDKHSDSFYEDGYIWTPVLSALRTKDKEMVYDLTVEGSHSFTANSVIVHNCQDLSVAGLQKGMKKGTRSGLLWEVERLLSEAKELPQTLVMENVIMVHSKKNMGEFQRWLDFLDGLGYHTCFADLNAIDFGIPQNRKRTIAVSTLRGEPFVFPKKIPLRSHLEDFLEEEVDEKFYVKGEKIDKMIRDLLNDPIRRERLRVRQDSILEVGNYGNPNGGWNQAYRVYSDKGVAPTLNTCQGGNRQPKVVVAQRGRYAESVVRQVGRNPDNPNQRIAGLPTSQRLEPNMKGVCNTLTTVQKDNYVFSPEDLSVRKLTPRECWRLMGFSDEDFERAATVNSNSQLYKEAGNAIVKQVLMAVFAQIYGLEKWHE